MCEISSSLNSFALTTTVRPPLYSCNSFDSLAMNRTSVLYTNLFKFSYGIILGQNIREDYP